MSLKDITKEIHTAAEKTDFMKSVFKGTMPASVWADYTYNKMLIYGAIERKAEEEGLLKDLSGIERSFKLYQDAEEMTDGDLPKFRQEAVDYHQYILDLPEGKVLAHLYTWHMGDLHGGQMIKKVMPDFPHRNLDFDNVEDLKIKIRSKLSDDLGDEAIKAFEWAIKLMNTYSIELPHND